MHLCLQWNVLHLTGHSNALQILTHDSVLPRHTWPSACCTYFPEYVLVPRGMFTWKLNYGKWTGFLLPTHYHTQFLYIIDINHLVSNIQSYVCNAHILNKIHVSDIIIIFTKITRNITITITPAESYPRYSSRFSPFSRMLRISSRARGVK